MSNGAKHRKIYSEDERVDEMSPTIRTIQKEKNAYVDGMKQYLKNLKSLSSAEIEAHSRKVLTESKILDKQGNFMNHHTNKD